MKRILAMTTLAALSTAPAVAEDRSFYWGFDSGQYQHNLGQNDLDASLIAHLETTDSTGLSGGSETSEDRFTSGLALGAIYKF